MTTRIKKSPEDDRRVALFDIDKTICPLLILFLAQSQVKAGLLHEDRVDQLRTALLNKKSYQPTIAQLNRIWVLGLAGKSYDVVLQHTIEFFEAQQEIQFFPFVQGLFGLLSPTHDIYFVSGEPQFVVEACANYFTRREAAIAGFASTQYIVDEGKLTGRYHSLLAYGAAKLTAIRTILKKYPHLGSVAFGDSVGDADMLAAVELPFCINASAELSVLAEAHDWDVVTPETIVSAVKKRLKSR